MEMPGFLMGIEGGAILDGGGMEARLSIHQ